QKRVQRLAMREVEATAARHQEFASGRRHGVKNRNARATLRQRLRRHQSGGTRADDGDFGLLRHYNFTPARAAAWLTYLLVCWNAFSSALAFDMSPISEKC